MLRKRYGQRYPKAKELAEALRQAFGGVVLVLGHKTGSRCCTLQLRWDVVLEHRTKSEVVSKSAWTKLRMIWSSERKQKDIDPARGAGAVDLIYSTVSSTCIEIPVHSGVVQNLNEAGFCSLAKQVETLGPTTTYRKANNDVPFGYFSSMKKDIKRIAFKGLSNYDMKAADLTVCCERFVPELASVLNESGNVRGLFLATMFGAQPHNWFESSEDAWQMIDRSQAVKHARTHLKAELKALRKARRRMKKEGRDLGLEVQRIRAAFINDVCVQQMQQHNNVYHHDQDGLWVEGELDMDIVERCKKAHNLNTVSIRRKD